MLAGVGPREMVEKEMVCGLGSGSGSVCRICDQQGLEQHTQDVLQLRQSEWSCGLEH